MPIDSNRLQSIFVAALQASDREAVLDRECGTDRELRQHVEKLLAAHDDSQSLPQVREQPTFTMGPTTITEAVGATIGPYKLKEQIGEGGFGLVFVAEQSEPVRRKVALKVIKPGMDSRQVIARFEAERQALALMDHPNIAKVLDAGATDSGRPYFVMELVRGIPITEYCDKNQLSPKDRLQLFVTVCHAIQHAHQKGIIHRDIKPSNVLVTSHDGAPVAKVIDFGVAKAINQQLTDRSIYTNFAQMIGTPLYMSPEQAEMSGLDIDTRSDIYSLGVLLYELLTGGTPIERNQFAKAAYDEIRRLIREEEPPKPSTRLSSSGSIASVAASRNMEPAKLSKLVRGDLDWITMRALEKDRTRRYETANGLARDIQRYLADEPVEACPPSTLYRLRKFARKNRAILTTAAALGLLLAVGLVAFAWQASVARTERDRAVKAQLAEAEQRQQAEAAREDALTQKSRAETQEAAARKQEAEAKKQAAIAEAVATFQTDMLAAVDPSQLPVDPETKQPLKDAVTVLQALAAAGKVLDSGSLADQPLVEARVRDTLGNTLSALGRYADAELNLQRALEIRRKFLPAEHLDIAASLNSSAVLLMIQNKLAEAESFHRTALEIRRKLLPAAHADIATSLNNLAIVLKRQNKLAEAEPLYREALEVSRQTLQAGHPDIAINLNNLAVLLKRRNKLDEAEQLYREALEIQRQALPAGHPNIAPLRHNLAQLLLSQNKAAEAEPLYREALEISRNALPAGHPDIGTCLLDLGLMLQAQKKFAESEPFCREALEIARASHPSDHPDVYHAMKGMADANVKTGKHSEAEAWAQEILESSRAILAENSPESAERLAAVGSILLDLQNWNEAEPLLRRSLAIREQIQPDDWQTPNTRSLLGGALLGQQKYAEAEPLLLAGYRGMQEREATFPPSRRVYLSNALARLIEFYTATDKPDEVAKWQAERAKYPDASQEPEKQ